MQFGYRDGERHDGRPVPDPPAPVEVCQRRSLRAGALLPRPLSRTPRACGRASGSGDGKIYLHLSQLQNRGKSGDRDRAGEQSGRIGSIQFGTRPWSCGFIPELWTPEKSRTDYVIPLHLAPLEPCKDRLALVTGYDVKLDSVPNKPHVTGCPGLRTGVPVPDRIRIAGLASKQRCCGR